MSIEHDAIDSTKYTMGALPIGSIDHSDVEPADGDRFGVYPDSVVHIVDVLDDGD